MAALAEIAAKYDADGIDVCFLNSKHVGNNMKVGTVRACFAPLQLTMPYDRNQDPELVRRLFDTVRPEGPTPIGEKLESLLLYYMDSLEKAKARADEGDHSLMRAIKPVNYIVITDGAPSKLPRFPL